MAFSFHRQLSSITHLLVKNEQRAVALSFVAGALLLLASFLPDIAAFTHASVSTRQAQGHWINPSQWLWLKLHWQEEFRQAAHFLFSASALLAVVLAYLRQGGATLDDLRVHFLFRGHTIICGMSNRSKILARDIAEKGRSVVIIDMQDKYREAVEQRIKGVCVIQGDAAAPDVLMQAGLEHASQILCLTESDETNISILESVRLAFGQHRQKSGHEPEIDCFCHIRNPSLRTHLERLPFMASKLEGGRFRLFNIEEITAAELLRSFPPERSVPLEQQAENVHVALLGGGNFAVALAIQMAQHCHYWRTDPADERFPRTLLTIVDADAEGMLQRLRWLCPAIDSVLDIKAVPVAPETPEAIARLLAARDIVISQLYVALGDEISTLAVATRLSQHAQLRNPSAKGRIVAITPARLNKIDPVAWNHSKAVEIFESYESCKDDVVIAGVRDRMACAAHDLYLREALSRGRRQGDRPALYPWARLNEFLRDSNRQQVAHVATKMRVLGWEIVPNPADHEALAEPIMPPVMFEQLAEMEHRRWMAFHLVRGWTYAPVRDDENREHDCLVAYAQLSEELKEYDRDAVRNMTRICREANFGLRPLQ